MSSPGDLLYWQASLKKLGLLLLEITQGELFRFQQGLNQAVIFLLVEGTVDIVPLRVGIIHFFRITSISGSSEGHVHVYGTGLHDGGHGVVEIEMLLTSKGCDLLGQGEGSQRAGGDDHHTSLRDSRDLLTSKGDMRMGLDTVGHLMGKGLTPDRQSSSGWDRCLIGAGQNE